MIKAANMLPKYKRSLQHFLFQPRSQVFQNILKAFQYAELFVILQCLLVKLFIIDHLLVKRADRFSVNIKFHLGV
jgi:hypothetical protein